MPSTAVAPDLLQRPLAEPWRRLAAMAFDLLAITLLSVLSGPWLGLGTGAHPELLDAFEREGESELVEHRIP